MQKISLFFGFFLICLQALAVNRALLVGIGHYPAESGWRNISAVNDVKLLEKTLRKTFEVETLTDRHARYSDIIKALNALQRKALYGDTILIHFSCHGQQVLTHDAGESDGLDEALVPYDAFSKKSRIYNGNKHLLDNELGKHLTALRKKVGRKGLVVVTLDACFSDSMNKGGQQDNSVIYRGGADIFGINDISKDSLRYIETHLRNEDRQKIDILPNGANIVIVSACRSYQRNMEVRKNGVGFGSLSYAMNCAFGKSSLHDINKWIDSVLQQMEEDAFTQSPQIRTTLKLNRAVHKTPETDENIDNGISKTFYVVAIAVVVLISIIILVLWTRFKKR